MDAGYNFQMTTFEMSNKLVATKIKGLVRVVLVKNLAFWV